MQIYNYIINQELPNEECVLALGLFDGVHIAHRDLISIAEKTAKDKNIRFGILTFTSDDELKSDSPRLYSEQRKLKLIERCGADFVVLCDFQSISRLTPEEFVKSALIQDLHCRTCVVGFNFRFGYKAAANANDLEKLMAEHGGRAIIRNELKLDGKAVSTTRIRALIKEGKIDIANKLLGYPYSVSGRVTRGNSKGRHLGFPTANTSFEKGALIPKSGVYRTAVPIGDKIYSAITNVGTCPTFAERPIHAETYIIDFDGDVYDDEIEIYFFEYLREEKRFNDEKELVLQINVDKNTTIKKNGDVTWQELGLK